MMKSVLIQDDTYQRALERADREGVVIIGKVTSRETGRTGWAVQGKQVYFVDEIDGRLHCTCMAHHRCKHCAVVTFRLIEQREAQKAAEKARALSIVVRNDSGPRLYRTAS